MNSKASAIFSILIIAVVFSSGCTSFGGSTTGGRGVVIENFEVYPTKVYPGESFQIQMKMRNAGSVDAQNVYPKLFNVGASVQGKSLEISCEGDCPSSLVMLAKDVERGTEGQSKTCTWKCYAPAETEIPKGLSVTFNPSVRLYYVYRTSTIKSINLVSQDELRTIENQGKALPSETASTTESPLQLDVIVNGPIRYWENEDKVTFPVNINVQNVGGGTACNPDSTCVDSANWNMFSLSSNTDGDRNFKFNSCEFSGVTKVFELWKGQSKTITCEVEIGDIQQTIRGFVQKDLKFDAEYRYFIDATTNIEVAGR